MWIRVNQTGLRLFWMRLLMLVCFVTGQTPLFPAGVGVALMLEGSHVVDVQGGGNQCRVTLHHVPPHLAAGEVAAPHRHGWISQMCVTRALDSGDSHPDHLLGFHSETADTISSAAGCIPLCAPLPLVAAEVNFLASPASGTFPPPSRWVGQPNPKPRHPACLSTIVLVI